MSKIKVELPLDIGDMIYGLNPNGNIWGVEVKEIKILKDSAGNMCFKFINNQELFFDVYSYQIGESIFLNYDDALDYCIEGIK